MASAVVNRGSTPAGIPERGKPTRWALTPLAPLVVSIVGAAAAVTIALVSSRELQRTSDEALQLQARTVSAALAARLTAAPLDARSSILERAHERTGARFALLDVRGRPVVERGPGVPPSLEVAELARRAAGLHEGSGSRLAFAVRSLGAPLEHLSLVTLVDAPSPAEGTLDLNRAVAVLAFLMLSVAVGVAVTFTAATREDLRIISRRIADLAKDRVGSAGLALRGKAVPLRSFDQVGTLTAALNGLVARFAHEERCYRSDLDAAAQIDTERAQFLAGLSHELRTPLNAVLGFAHLLESDGPLSAEAQEAVAMIRTSGEHLKTLIDDILDLSAAETGQLRLSRNVVDLRLVAEEVVREARGMVGSRDIAVLLDAPGPTRAWADARRVRQILGNLVSNALKATARGEVRVTVSSVPEQRTVRIVVSDTGRGIEPAALEAIFEPYRQEGDESVRRGGAGLGLAITRQLVLLHGGSIEATSTLHRGSTFDVRIPDDSRPSLAPRQSLIPSDELVRFSDEDSGPEPARDVLPSLSNEITERRRRLKGP